MQQAALDEVDADFKNVRAAWNWAVERGQALNPDVVVAELLAKTEP
jgi:hypothetical protein